MEYIALAKTFLNSFNVMNVRSRAESFLMLSSYLKSKGMTSLEKVLKEEISSMVSSKYPSSFKDILNTQISLELDHYFSLASALKTEEVQAEIEDPEAMDPEYDPEFFADIGMEMPK